MTNEERIARFSLMLLCVHNLPLMRISIIVFRVLHFEIFDFEKLNKTFEWHVQEHLLWQFYITSIHKSLSTASMELKMRHFQNTLDIIDSLTKKWGTLLKKGTCVIIGSFVIMVLIFMSIFYLFQKREKWEEQAQEKYVKSTTPTLFLHGYSCLLYTSDAADDAGQV